MRSINYLRIFCTQYNLQKRHLAKGTAINKGSIVISEKGEFTLLS